MHRACSRAWASTSRRAGNPAGRGVRDEAQLALIARLKPLVVSHWEWRTEVPIPLAGDPRAWEVVLRGPAASIGVKAETRLRDIQALDRRVMLKLRDSGLKRVIILVAPTRTNRATLREVGDSIRTNYPISSRHALNALMSGQDPGGNAILALGASSTAPTTVPATMVRPARREFGGDGDGHDSSQIGVPDRSRSNLCR